MKLSYRLKRVCGNVFENGNIVFTSDGNSIICPVGNRVTVFNLVQHSSFTLPFENRKNIRKIAVSNNGRFLVTVDIEGHALFINLSRRVILQRFNFKRKVYDLKFSPNDEMFAVTFGHGVQIWRTPGIRRQFCPLTLNRNIGGHHDDTVCLDWSEDSQNLIMGSKDLAVRVFHNVNSKKMSLTVLTGHRDRLVGAYFSKDGKSAYTVARDGAVFTWKYELVDVVPSIKDKKRNSNMDDHDDNDDYEDISDDEEGTKTVKKKGTWKLVTREFLWEPHTQVTSVAFNKPNSLLVVGIYIYICIYTYLYIYIYIYIYYT
jgi:periodic tryptophan protein 2